MADQADQVSPLEQPAQPTEQPPEAVVPAAPPPIIPIVPKSSLTFRQRWSAFLRWFKAPENIAVCAMAAVVLALHIILINTPPGLLSTPEWMRQDALNKRDITNPAPSPQYIFDELHYVPEAVRFLHREAPDAEHGIVRPEHPPLGKWLIASGIFFFGDNPVGWRLPSIIFGLASIFIFYFICRKLAGQEPDQGADSHNPPAGGFWGWLRVSTFVPLLATFLFAFENMSFIQAQVAMLDPFYLTFMLLGILFYLRKNWAIAGACLGLSMLSKSMAVLPILGLFAHWAVTRRHEIANELKFTWNALRGRKEGRPEQSEILGIVKFLVVIPIVWFALLLLLEYPVTRSWVNPMSRTLYMLTSHLGLKVGGTLASGIATRPWSWLYYPGGLNYWYTPHFLGAIGWTVWALIMPSMAYLIFELARERFRGVVRRLRLLLVELARGRFLGVVRGLWLLALELPRGTGGHAVAAFGLIWFIGVYGLLVPLELATDRLMYIFYFYPAVPAVSLAIAWGAWKLWGLARRGKKRRIAFMVGLSVYILATVASFVIMSPWGTNLITLPSRSG